MASSEGRLDAAVRDAQGNALDLRPGDCRCEGRWFDHPRVGALTGLVDAGHAPMGEAACTGWTRLRPSCEQGAVIAGACRPEGHGCGGAYPLL
jgi:hypothetical protein